NGTLTPSGSGIKGGLNRLPMPLTGSDTCVDFAPTSTDICILFFNFFAKKVLRGRFLFFPKFYDRSVGARDAKKGDIIVHGWLRDRMKD
ncbi:MAG: hypothetical protein WAL37_00285, partial [Xanthobacteraceae bacterium]